MRHLEKEVMRIRYEGHWVTHAYLGRNSHRIYVGCYAVAWRWGVAHLTTIVPFLTMLAGEAVTDIALTKDK